MAKKPSASYLAAKAALVEIFSDGNEHNCDDVQSEMQRRGFDLDNPETDRALGSLHPILLGPSDDGQHGWAWHLPRHPRPKGVCVHGWALAFWRAVLADGEKDAIYVLSEAEEYRLSFRAFIKAKCALGVLHREDRVPFSTLEDGSTMYRIDEYWRLPE